MAELVGIVDDLRRRGVGLKVLTGEGAAIDTTRPEGRFILGVFAAFAEFERELIREWTREGMKAARRRASASVARKARAGKAGHGAPAARRRQGPHAHRADARRGPVNATSRVEQGSYRLFDCHSHPSL
jgi:DNA invertase Pin-like site-specific DNA recombinase